MPPQIIHIQCFSTTAVVVLFVLDFLESQAPSLPNDIQVIPLKVRIHDIVVKEYPQSNIIKYYWHTLTG